MHLMADAVARFGEIDTVFFGNGLDIFVVIGVFKACLQCVVVNICNRFFCFNSGNANGFKLQISHSTCGILCQGLVNFDGDFLAGNHFSADQMRFNQFFSDIHVKASSIFFHSLMYAIRCGVSSCMAAINSSLLI